MVTLNGVCVQAIERLLASRPFADADPLFAGQRGPLTVPSVHRLVTGWCRAVRLKGNYGSHSLRKTWGYHQGVTFGTEIPKLMVCFNHSNQRQTLYYLCIQPEEIREVYTHEL
jgi:integrase